MLENIEEYLKTIDVSLLNLEELEHYTQICILLEKRHLDLLERKAS